MTNYIFLLFVLLVVIAFIFVLTRITGGVGDLDPVVDKGLKETLMDLNTNKEMYSLCANRNMNQQCDELYETDLEFQNYYNMIRKRRKVIANIPATESAIILQNDGTAKVLEASYSSEEYPSLFTPISGHKFIEVSASYDCLAGLQDNGIIKFWGDLEYAPKNGILEPDAGTKFIQVANANDLCLGLQDNGIIKCFGNLENLRIPPNRQTHEKRYIRPDPDKKFVQVVAFHPVVMALQSDGIFKLWRMAPNIIREIFNPDSGYKFMQIEMSYNLIVALQNNGVVKLWKYNSGTYNYEKPIIISQDTKNIQIAIDEFSNGNVYNIAILQNDGNISILSNAHTDKTQNDIIMKPDSGGRFVQVVIRNNYLFAIQNNNICIRKNLITKQIDNITPNPGKNFVEP